MSQINLPLLKVYTSPILIKKLLGRDLSEEELQKFKEYSQSFKLLLDKEKEKILKNISELVGVNWEEKDITVYIIPESTKIPSMANPLLLKIREDSYFNLYILIHELFHRFLEFNNKLQRFSEKVSVKKAGIKAEALVEFLTIELSNKIFGKEKAEALYSKEKEIVTSRDTDKSNELVKEFRKRYDLEEKPLIVWLETPEI